jgi:hypothetical protein
MLPRLIQSQKRLLDRLFELYMQGRLELYLAGTHGVTPDVHRKM